jgi:site-specific DNA-cytosine methylase
LKPLTTAKDVLRQIPQNAPSHNVRAATTGRRYPVWDDAMQTPTICTAGLTKDNRVLGHPSGLRKLTPTELAGLQGVPSHHIFPSEKNIVNNKLIGNVYPSSMAKIHFENIRKHLEKTDEAERRRNAAPF